MGNRITNGNLISDKDMGESVVNNYNTFFKANAVEDGIEPVGSGERNYSFDYSKMYAYASCYNKASPYRKSKRNSNYYDFENDGGDCTNYISQILHAGGAPLDDTGNYTWYYYNVDDRSPSWTAVDSLYKYLIRNDYIGPQGYEIVYDQTNNLNKGDLVQFDFGKGYAHSAWVISHKKGTFTNIRIATHTKDRWNEPIDSISCVRRRYIKLTRYMK